MSYSDQISTLNILIYNFAFLPVRTSTLQPAIEEIDKLFADIKPEEVQKVINSARKKAKVVEVTENDIIRELNRKRTEIRQMIAEKMTPMPEDDYINLVTQLAKTLVTNPEHGGIIDDVVDQYEIRMHDQIEKKGEDIRHSISILRNTSCAEATLNYKVDELIRDVRAWDVLAQPIQLKGQSSGLTHEISRQLGQELQQLSVFLHNEKNATAAAARLTKEMQSVFAELPELATSFTEAHNTLSRLRDEQESVAGLTKDLDNLKEEAERVGRAEVVDRGRIAMASDLIEDVAYDPDFNYGLQKDANYLLNHASDFNQKLDRITSIDAETKNKIRTVACMMVRGAAIKLHNEHNETEIAADMLSSLMHIFGDIPELGGQLRNEQRTLENMKDAAKLNRAIKNGRIPASIRTSNGIYSSSTGTGSATRSYSSYSSSKSKSSSSGIGSIIGFIVFIIFALVSSSNGML